MKWSGSLGIRRVLPGDSETSQSNEDSRRGECCAPTRYVRDRAINTRIAAPLLQSPFPTCFPPFASSEMGRTKGGKCRPHRRKPPCRGANLLQRRRRIRLREPAADPALASPRIPRRRRAKRQETEECRPTRSEERRVGKSGELGGRRNS